MSAAAETRPLTYRVKIGEPLLDLKAYEAQEGYLAMRRAVQEMAPADVTQLVKDSNLRGRGGGRAGRCRHAEQSGKEAATGMRVGVMHEQLLGKNGFT